MACPIAPGDRACQLILARSMATAGRGCQDAGSPDAPDFRTNTFQIRRYGNERLQSTLVMKIKCRARPEPFQQSQRSRKVVIVDCFGNRRKVCTQGCPATCRRLHRRFHRCQSHRPPIVPRGGRRFHPAASTWIMACVGAFGRQIRLDRFNEWNQLRRNRCLQDLQLKKLRPAAEVQVQGLLPACAARLRRSVPPIL